MGVKGDKVDCGDGLIQIWGVLWTNHGTGLLGRRADYRHGPPRLRYIKRDIVMFHCSNVMDPLTAVLAFLDC